MKFTKKISIVITIFLFIQSYAENMHDNLEDYTDDDSSQMNDSLPISSSIKIKPLTTKTSFSSRIITALSTTSTRSNTINPSTTLTTTTTTTTTTQRRPITAAPMPPYILANNLLDQFNHYRNVDILSRIKQCDSKMKLTDICEIYTIDNHTYSVIRDANVEFQSLQQLYEILIDRLIVKKIV